MPHYLVRVGDAISQLLNTVFLNGDPNESISGRAYRQGWRIRVIIDAIFWPFETEHCKNAFDNDLRKARELVNNALENP